MEIINQINDYLWGYPVLTLILLGGIYLSIRLKFPQFHLIKIFRTVSSKLSCDTRCDGENLTQRQGFSTALAAAVGTGSVVGVGAALCTGGKGAIFWMWVSAFLGMAISYAENFLGTRYSNESGRKIFGAMSYLKAIGKGKILPVSYAAFSVLASLGMGNMAQANSAVSAACEGFGISKYACAVGVVVFTFFILAGKNSACKICERLVPIMALIFISGNLFIILRNPLQTLSAVGDIIRSAFTPSALAGGGLGTVCIEGIKRGVFSNEAGLGSSPAIHSDCKEKSEEIQGIMGMSEIFIDTVIICTLTALTIIVSGVEFTPDCAVKSYSVTLGNAGRIFICISLILFSLATIAGWFFIGEKSWLYIFPKMGFVYRCIFLVCVYIGAVYSPALVWSLSDIFNGLTAIPNMAGVLILSRQITPPKAFQAQSE